MAAVVVGLCASPASATTITIDTNGTWDGSINNGWAGSGQSLTVPVVESVLDDIGFYFDAASLGKTFDFYVDTAMNGGSTLFSTSFTVTPGINVITTNLALAPGSQVWVLLDYNGFSGQTAHFSYTDGYAGGNSVFGPYGSYIDYAGLDHRFIAHFSGPTIPEPATLLLLGTGLVGAGVRRRLKRRG